jgi:hypothetical protein
MNQVGTKFRTLENTARSIAIKEAEANAFDAVFDGFLSIVTNDMINTVLIIPWNNHIEVTVFTHSTISVDVVTFAGGSNNHAIRVFRHVKKR